MCRQCLGLVRAFSVYYLLWSSTDTILILCTKKLRPQGSRGFPRVAQAGHTSGGIESMSSATKAHTVQRAAIFLSVWPGPPHSSPGLCCSSTQLLPGPSPDPWNPLLGSTALEYSWLVNSAGLLDPPKSRPTEPSHRAQISHPSLGSMLVGMGLREQVHLSG